MPFQFDPNSAAAQEDKPVTGSILPGMNPRSQDRTAIALPAGVKARLCHEAIRRRCTVSELIRQAIAEYLDWPDIVEARPVGRPLDAAKEAIRKEKREKVPIPTCVNVPRRKHQKGL